MQWNIPNYTSMKLIKFESHFHIIDSHNNISYELSVSNVRKEFFQMEKTFLVIRRILKPTLKIFQTKDLFLYILFQLLIDILPVKIDDAL